LAGSQELLFYFSFFFSNPPSSIYSVPTAGQPVTRRSPWGPARTRVMPGGRRTPAPFHQLGACPEGGAAHRRSELCLFSAAFPRCPGLPIAGCWACLQKACFLLYSGERHYFPPSFCLPVAAEGAGNFTRAPSHRQPNPTSLGSPGAERDGSSLAVVANIHGFSCQSPSPPWPSYPAHARIDESPRCPP